MDRAGASGRGAVLPRSLETFADQPWLRTAALGYHPEPAQRFRSTRFVTQQRGLGNPLEKYREDSTRVNETEQPDAVSRHISHAQPPVPAYRGIPPVEFAAIVDKHAAQKWPPLKYAPESFAVHHVRGPTLAPLAVDPGPLYSLSEPSPGKSVAPTLLAVTRGYAAAAARAAQQGSDGAEAPPDAPAPPPAPDAPWLPAAGSLHGSLLTAEAPSTAALGGDTHRAGGWDPARTVSAQFSGASAAASHVDRDLLAVGPVAAVAVPRSLQGAASLLHMESSSSSSSGNNGSSSSSSSSGSSTQPLAAALGAGAVGAPHPHLRSVLHPLDAFPSTRRAVSEEAVGRAAAEQWRRRVAGAQRRQDYITLHAYPHGVLGCDGPDNVGSAVYGEVARRRLEAGAVAERRAAAREAALLQHTCSVARRGYDLLARDASGASVHGEGVGALSMRLPPTPQAADALSTSAAASLSAQQQQQQQPRGPTSGVAALAASRHETAVDGVRFLGESRAHAVPLHGQGVDTRRTVGVYAGVDASVPAFKATRPARMGALVANASREGSNPITGQPLPYSPPRKEERLGVGGASGGARHATAQALAASATLHQQRAGVLPGM